MQRSCYFSRLLFVVKYHCKFIDWWLVWRQLPGRRKDCSIKISKINDFTLIVLVSPLGVNFRKRLGIKPIINSFSGLCFEYSAYTTAFLVFIATAAGTRIITSNLFRLNLCLFYHLSIGFFLCLSKLLNHTSSKRRINVQVRQPLFCTPFWSFKC